MDLCKHANDACSSVCLSCSLAGQLSILHGKKFDDICCSQAFHLNSFIPAMFRDITYLCCFVSLSVGLVDGHMCSKKYGECHFGDCVGEKTAFLKIDLDSDVHEMIF